MVYTVISFYRYVPLQNPQALRESLFQNCQEREILGRVLIGEEGINGAVCGEEEKIVSFQTILESSFPDLTYREQKVETQTYHKLVVRVRKEIVAFGKRVDPSKPACHISPETLKQWYDTGKDFVIIDARNEHEAKVGKFKDAVVLPIHSFREFPGAIQKMDLLRDKEVVMYCTGGIRCEKASAYMKEQGFSHVSQLDGGIINYVNQYPDTHYEGACFVFDDRLVSSTDTPISTCALCETPCADYTNCFNLDCDKLFLCCNSCKEKMKNTCSTICMHADRQRKIIGKKEENLVIGVVENYYPQAKVVLVRVEKELQRDATVTFYGTTTKNVQETIIELRDYDGNILEKAEAGMRVTFPVQGKIRAHDKVCAL